MQLSVLQLSCVVRELLHEVTLEGKHIELRTEVLPSRPLGFAAFQTRAGLKSLKLRRL